MIRCLIQNYVNLEATSLGLKICYYRVTFYFESIHLFDAFALKIIECYDVTQVFN